MHKSNNAIDKAASNTGTALTAIQGSCLPLIISLFSFLVFKFKVNCPFAIEGVGFIATFTIIGIPFEIPPKIPPLLFVLVFILLFFFI